MAADAKLEVILSAKNLAKKGFDDFEYQAKKTTKSVENQFTKMAAVAKAAAITIASSFALKSVATSAINVASSFEQMEIKLNTLTKGRGKQTLEELNKWALEMPVNTQQAVEAFTKMTAYGLQPTLEKMQILVDVGSVFGDETLPRVSRALGQMQALGKLSAEELNQLSEAGINARKYLSQAFGMTVEELQKSGIEIEKIIDAIWKGMNAEFGGSAKAAMKSWQGLTAILKSYIVEIQRTAMNAGIFDALKDALSGVNEQLRDYIKNNSTLLQQDVRGYVEGTATAVRTIVDIYSVLPDGVVGAAGAGLVGRILFGGWGAARLLSGFVFVNTQMEKLGQGLSEFGKMNDRLGRAGGNLWDFISGKRDFNTGELKGMAADVLELETAARRSAMAMTNTTKYRTGGSFGDEPFRANPPPAGGGGAKKPTGPSGSQLEYMQYQGAQLAPDWFAGMPEAGARAQAILDEVAETADESFKEISTTQLGWLDGAKMALAEYQVAAFDTFSNVRDVFASGLNTMEDFLVDFVTTGKLEFKDLINSILEDLARLVIRQNITGPLAGLLSRAFAGGAGSQPLSVISGTSYGTAFGAAGGVFSGPTSGYPATMHGTEAIVPLSGGRSIPVEMKGAGDMEVNIHNYGDKQVTARQSQTVDGKRQLMIEIGNDIRSMGPTGQAIGSRFGLAARGIA